MNARNVRNGVSVGVGLIASVFCVQWLRDAALRTNYEQHQRRQEEEKWVAAYNAELAERFKRPPKTSVHRHRDHAGRVTQTVYIDAGVAPQSSPRLGTSPRLLTEALRRFPNNRYPRQKFVVGWTIYVGIGSPELNHSIIYHRGEQTLLVMTTGGGGGGHGHSYTRGTDEKLFALVKAATRDKPANFYSLKKMGCDATFF